MWYVYIARQSNGHFYVGISELSHEALLRQHGEGRHASYTTRRTLIRIEWAESRDSLEAARRRELQLKKWTHARSRRSSMEISLD